MTYILIMIVNIFLGFELFFIAESKIIVAASKYDPIVIIADAKRLEAWQECNRLANTVIDRTYIDAPIHEKKRIFKEAQDYYNITVEEQNLVDLLATQEYNMSLNIIIAIGCFGLALITWSIWRLLESVRYYEDGKNWTILKIWTYWWSLPLQKKFPPLFKKKLIKPLFRYFICYGFVFYFMMSLSFYWFPY